MLYKDDLNKIDKWFDKKEKEWSWGGTYHHTKERDGEDLYVISAEDVKEFCELLAREVVDAVGVSCLIGYDGVWFKRADLEGAETL